MTDEYHFFSWGEGEGRLKSVSMSNRGPNSTVKIELEVTNPFRLGRLIEQLTEIQRAQDRPKAGQQKKDEARK